MRYVSVYEFRNNLSEFLDYLIANNTPIAIKRYNKPIAILNKYNKEKDDFDPMKYYGFLGSGTTGEEFVNKIRRNKKELTRIKYLRNR